MNHPCTQMLLRREISNLRAVATLGKATAAQRLRLDELLIQQRKSLMEWK